MSFMYLLCLVLLEYFNCPQVAEGWDFLNLQCRDDNNEPVDWWYIYKPPSSTDPYLEQGINYSYITPDNELRWQASPEHIFGDSMLRYTLSPMFNEEYTDFIATVEYEARSPMGDFMGSTSRGLIITNSLGGLWIGHTIPGFPDTSTGVPMFPKKELKNGHLIMCLTLELSTVNALATAIKQSEPIIKNRFIPQRLVKYFPNWDIFSSPLETLRSPTVRKTKVINFVTKGKSLRGIILARSPGDSRCLYKNFAKTQQIVLDVYGHKGHNNAHCHKNFSLRNIDSVSLKYPQAVIHYINNASDSTGFAVSTAASWQRKGFRNMSHYWTCTGNIENQPVPMGGIMACVYNVRVWLSFDNLKTKEPECSV